MNTVLEINSLKKYYGEAGQSDESSERDYISGDGRRIPRDYGKQWIGKIDAAKLHCHG